MELFPKILALDSTNDYFLFGDMENPQIKELVKQNKNGQAVFVHTSTRHYSFGEQTSFLRLLNKYELDLVHFPNFNFPIFYKRPFVVTIHDMVHHKISGAKKSHYLHFLAYKKVIETAAKNAARIVTVSEASKHDIIKYLQINPEKITVTYEGGPEILDVSDSYIEQVKKKLYSF